MSRSERDLAIALRAELAAIDPARACDRTAEALGLGAGARASTHREGPVARLAVRLRRGAEEAERGGGAGRDAKSRPDAFSWETAPDHCRTAWLRGRFLARGSLSLAGGRTHLEFVVGPDEAPVLAARLADIDLPASWRIRRGRGVVTWKSGEAVGTFLRRIGAGGALLELEARQVSRALRGDLNRVLNAEFGKPPASGQRGRTSARRDRRARRRRAAGRTAGHRAPRRGSPARDTRGDPQRPGRAVGRSSVGRPAGAGAGRAPRAPRRPGPRAAPRCAWRPPRRIGPAGRGRFARASSGMIRHDA